MTAEQEPPEQGETEVEEEEPPWPVGFIILVSLGALYVGWRLIQLIVRGLDWLF